MTETGLHRVSRQDAINRLVARNDHLHNQIANLEYQCATERRKIQKEIDLNEMSIGFLTETDDA